MLCRALLVLAVSLAATPALAQVVSKCPDGKGGHVYQSDPCQHGQAVRQYDTAAVRDSPERIRRIQAEDRQRAAALAARSPAARGSGVSIVQASGVTQQQARCNAAKAYRQRELDRLGLRRTYDTLRTLNDYVNRECKRR